MRIDPSGHAWYDVLAWIGVGLVVAATVVLTVGAAGFAVGGLAGAIIHGAAVGALIGASAGAALGAGGSMIYDAIQGNDFGTSIWTGVKMGFGIGAIVGAAIGGAWGGISYTPSGLSKSAINGAVKKAVSDPNKMNHIMQAKHGLPNTVKAVGQLMRKTLINGVITPYKAVESVIWATASSQVTYVIIDGIIKIGDMWIF